MIATITSGALQSNCFVVGCDRTKQAIVVDPGDDVDRIVEVLDQNGLAPIAAVMTHGHFDHLEGNQRLVDHYDDLPVWCHRDDARMLTSSMYNMSSLFAAPVISPAASRFLEDGETVEVGNLRLAVLLAPGHTPGSIGLYEPTEKFVIVGDVLFAGGIGRTDFPGGDHRQLVEAIRDKLMTLADDTTVYPGHGPATTIGRERETNPFI